mmetsp:Transcript_99561/g.277151  ORF Transcript_99561/g.277151 Transcript_99561/m.277151 type:complete len:468 (+) Transcript_99561:131-1534(+)
MRWVAMWQTRLLFEFVLFARVLVRVETGHASEGAPLQTKVSSDTCLIVEQEALCPSLVQGAIVKWKVKPEELDTRRPHAEGPPFAAKRPPIIAVTKLLQNLAGTDMNRSLQVVGHGFTALVQSLPGSVTLWSAGAVVVFVGLCFCTASFCCYMLPHVREEQQEELLPSAPGPTLVAKRETSPLPKRGASLLPSRRARTPSPWSAASMQPSRGPSPDSAAGHAASQPGKEDQSSLEAEGRGQAAPQGQAPLRGQVPRQPPALGAPVPEEGLTLGAPDGPRLCPELVVPEGNECVLFVPVARPSATESSVTVSDSHGMPVFNATFKSDQKHLVLTSATGSGVFASCREAEMDQDTHRNRDNRSSVLTIFYRSEQPYGTLRGDGPRPAHGYSVSAHTGWRVRFRGDPESHNLNATDDQGHLLAITEQGTTKRAIRIGPNVDAGLVALAVLGIDLLVLASSRAAAPALCSH